jgi:mRNA interferase MazF
MLIRRGEIWRVNLDPTIGAEIRKTRPLEKVSAVDALQLRGVDTQRFVEKLGAVSPAVMRSIAAAITAVVEYQ